MAFSDKPHDKGDGELSTNHQNGQFSNGGSPNGINGHTAEHASPQHNNKKEKDNESQRLAAPRSRFAAAIQTFSPVWFAVVMNTGILGIIMQQNPQPYNGFWWQISSYILYVLALILFIIFMLIYLLRAILYPRTVPGPSSDQPAASVETTSLAACMPIAAFTLIAHTTITASAADWNGSGYGFALFSYIAWWICMLWIVSTAQTTLVNLARSGGLSPNSLAPAVIIPGVGVVTCALVGSLVVTYGTGMTATLAMPVIVVGYCLVGFGISWAFFIYAVFLVRLLDTGFPPPDKIITLLFLVGPPGQAAGAFVGLGQAAEMYLPSYGSPAGSQSGNPIFTAAGGQTFSALGVFLAFGMLGLYALWLIFALYGIGEAVFSGKVRAFNLSFWGSIFPIATGNLAFVKLGIALNSPAFGVLSCIWLVVLFVDYFGCWIGTIVGIWKGEILDGRDEDEKIAAREKAD